MKKAQLWSTDFSISVVIFFSVMMLVVFAWSFVGYQNQQRINFNEMENTAHIISDSMVRTAGEPISWNQTNVETIGLASDENILNMDKVDYFINMSYAEIVSKLGVQGNLYFELRDISGNVIQNLNGDNITKGTYPTASATMVVPVERYCIYDDEVATLRLIMWV